MKKKNGQTDGTRRNAGRGPHWIHSSAASSFCGSLLRAYIIKVWLFTASGHGHFTPKKQKPPDGRTSTTMTQSVMKSPGLPNSRHRLLLYRGRHVSRGESVPRIHKIRPAGRPCVGIANKQFGNSCFPTTNAKCPFRSTEGLISSSARPF